MAVRMWEVFRPRPALFAGDNMGPSKLEKAQKLGVTIVSEEEFLQMIE